MWLFDLAVGPDFPASVDRFTGLTDPRARLFSGPTWGSLSLCYAVCMNTRSQKPALSVLPGCRGDIENDERFRQLLASPASFDQREYEAIIEAFRDRLTINDILALSARRIRERAGDALEKRTLLAIIEGRFDEVERLFAVIDRRNDLGLTVIKDRARKHLRSE